LIQIFLSIEPLIGPIGALGLSGIDWVIAGGERGRGARLMNPEWVRSIRDQCLRAGVAFFFKHWGGLRPKSGGRELDGREGICFQKHVRATPSPPRRAARQGTRVASRYRHRRTSLV
jgi:protein gp37